MPNRTKCILMLSAADGSLVCASKSEPKAVSRDGLRVYSVRVLIQGRGSAEILCKDAE
jgi:hypothetical protein